MICFVIGHGGCLRIGVADDEEFTSAGAQVPKGSKPKLLLRSTHAIHDTLLSGVLQFT